MTTLFVPPTMAAVRGLIAQLEDLDVTIPNQIPPLLAAHDRITAAGPYLAGPQVELADLGPDDVMRWAALRANEAAIQDTRVHAEMLLAAEVADYLTAAADDIIDQLRPAFDKAADYFTAARKLGVTETTTADQLLDMPPKAVTAWKACADHIETLARIATVRIAMSRTLGLPPGHDATATTYAACFSNAGAGWDNNTRTRGLWLRLAATGLVLQHVDDTADLTRVVRIPIVAVDPTLETASSCARFR